MRTTFSTVAAAAFILATSGNAFAHDHNSEVRHVAAHVHGEGELNFAIDSSELHMELMMSAHDILGFETITTAAQQQQLDEALEKLQSENLWTLPKAAKCRLGSAHAAATGHNSHDDHGHGHDTHGRNHDNQGGHMDIAASYVFQCENIESLNQLSTTLFETFPRSEKIRVQGFTASGQLSEHMSPQQTEVGF